VKKGKIYIVVLPTLTRAYMNKPIRLGIVKNTLISLISAAIAGCGGNSSPPDNETNPPSVTITSSPSDGYEHKNTYISANVTDDTGLDSVILRYRVSGQAAWTETPADKSGNSYSKNLDLESEAYEFQVYARDLSGNEKQSGIITAKKWADEASSDSKLDSALALYESNGDVIFYDTNYTLDLSGNLVEVDALAIPAGKGSKAIFYKGENDGNFAVFKSILEANGIDVIIINPCLEKDIPNKLEQIKANGWQAGSY
jgi:hypothetical protein